MTEGESPVDDTTTPPAPDEPAPAGKTQTFKNVSTIGDLDIPGIGIVPAGATVEVPAALAEQFSTQPDLWKKAPK